jgi:hypothetical protein
MRIGSAIIAAIVGSALIGACSGTQTVKDAAPQIAAFHHALDAEDYASVWRDSDGQMKAATSQADLTKLLAAVHKKLGRVIKSDQTGWNVNYGTSGQVVTVGMNTAFEHGKGAETFTFIGHGDKLSLAGYNMNSADMMMN